MMRGLAELGEHAEGGFGMEEGDELFAGSLEGDFMDQFRALVLRLGELAGDVVSGEGDVVDAAGGVLFEKLRDGALR
jgi:hypothetical protein